VKDVELRKPPPTNHDKIYEGFEGSLFIGARERQITQIRRPGVRLELIAEEIFEPVLADKGIPFDIKKNSLF
jgi:hypothetical protein